MMPTYRVYRDGKTELVEADGYTLRDNCLTLQSYEQHAADATCACEAYHRLDDDGQPRAHQHRADIVTYAADYWHRVERVNE